MEPHFGAVRALEAAERAQAAVGGLLPSGALPRMPALPSLPGLPGAPQQLLDAAAAARSAADAGVSGAISMVTGGGSGAGASPHFGSAALSRAAGALADWAAAPLDGVSLPSVPAAPAALRELLTSLGDLQASSTQLLATLPGGGAVLSGESARAAVSALAAQQ
eukprot:356244-Chlamydomonas_euryale.AAC.1